ncbi:hypothetical protein ILUMI_00391 [Ignelater luminosus]|uniref:Ubiquitin carboxyl-terminal hydrolase MINDY n=1 Tax=Ignelater luminosus TaxID=2038154 RepID=A0A8K0DLZ9_IGNLU|nr:hypothetical protein ILUMI_00391 [Ignelater luminosus]
MERSLSPVTEQELLGIKHLLWGPDIKHEIFKRWSQGFYFSTNEKSALEQAEGGPCAIIAPMQAFILKKLLADYNGLSFRYSITEEIQHTVLIHALCEILQQCSTERYHIIYLKNQDLERESSSSVINGDTSKEEFNDNDLATLNEIFDADAKIFHDNLVVHMYPLIADVEKYYKENINSLKAQYGVLLFLYSVIATKGLEHVKMESGTNDPLIDETYGYGSQNLINLMITGKAVTYVWDNYQDVGGLKLKGLDKQSQIGFITLMEHLRYCTVGSFYKNPIHPVWVLGSETHLTVLFSDERKLVSPETKSEEARRIFKSFDPDGNNFISSSSLQEVLAALDLVSDQEYVDIMKKKLDSENLGIILLNAFMDEFFPKEESSIPDMFQLIHYNGLARSNVNKEVQYHFGSAILLESDLKSINDSDPMLTCLQTKWPNIEVQWCDNITPSLN